MSVYITLVVLICSYLQNTSAQDARAALATLEFRAENQTEPCHGLLLSSEWFITKKGCTKRKPGFEILKVVGKEVSPLRGLFSEGHFGGPADKEEERNYELLRSSVPILLKESDQPHDVLTKEGKQSFEVIQKAIKKRCGGPEKDALVAAVLEGVGYRAEDLKKSVCEQQWDKNSMAMSKRSVFGKPELKGGFATVIFGPGTPSDEPADPGFNGIGDIDTLIGYAYAEPEAPFAPEPVVSSFPSAPTVHYLPGASIPFVPPGWPSPSSRSSIKRSKISHEKPDLKVMGAPGLLGVWGAPGWYGQQAQEQYSAPAPAPRHAEENYEPSTRHNFNQAASYHIDESTSIAPAAPPAGGSSGGHKGGQVPTAGYPSTPGYPSPPPGFVPAPGVPVPGYPGPYVYPPGPYAPFGAPGQNFAANTGTNLGFVGSPSTRRASSAGSAAGNEDETMPSEVIIQAA